ncbi:bleomycin resistance protein [Brevundimonas aveniformis]|uniref:bleomycin resistance protein n=1 Tax=Brevundimonas aveniformis TaxID=370977 RepID=UPI002490A8E8|nr:VOC family protein [Brevundimonas aveniformis]
MLIAAEPQLFVRDLEKALDHYQEALGFEVAFQYGEPAFYAQVARDGARLNLRQTDQPAWSEALKDGDPDLLSATITTDAIDALFAEFSATGAVFHRRLHTEPWGARTFIVRDPDGNLICFAG